MSDEEDKDNVEENTGVDFPGDSLESLIGTTLNFEDTNFVNEIVIAEVGDPDFAFRFVKQERSYVGQCEFCSKRALLRIICECKRVRYCDKACQQKDQRFHLPQCSAQADDELNKLTLT